jgi:microcystin-dependent protein
MSDQFLGEIRQVGFNFPPSGWAQCDGQLMAISQNTALFSLLGTNFGGNGTTNFALPNLQGNVSVGIGQGNGLSQYVIGEQTGTETVTLLQSEMPSHNHTVHAEGGRAAATLETPVGNAWGKSGAGDTPYGSGSPDITMSGLSTTVAGGSQPHNNLMPYLVVNFVIALTGIFPSRN